MTPSTQRRRRGYFILEMMVLLALLGMFALIAGKLLIASMTAMAQGRHREDAAQRFDMAMNQLRADVSSARLIEADGQSATLLEDHGRKIVWRIEPEVPDEGGAPDPFGPSIRITRRVEQNAGLRHAIDPSPATEPDAGTQWEPLPAGITFMADGPMLRVHVPASDEHRTTDAGDLTVMSQLLLSGRPP